MSNVALGFGFYAEWELNEKVSFDGATRVITVYPWVTELDIREDVWSAWVRWNDLDGRLNDRWPLAMQRTGLDPIPGGVTGDFYFLANNWKLSLNLANVKVTGVLYSRDFDTAYYDENINPVYPAVVSSVVNTVATGGASDCPTVADIRTQIEEAISAALLATAAQVANITTLTEAQVKAQADQALSDAGLSDSLTAPEVRAEVDQALVDAGVSGAVTLVNDNLDDKVSNAAKAAKLAAALSS